MSQPENNNNLALIAEEILSDGPSDNEDDDLVGDPMILNDDVPHPYLLSAADRLLFVHKPASFIPSHQMYQDFFDWSDQQYANISDTNWRITFVSDKVPVAMYTRPIRIAGSSAPRFSLKCGMIIFRDYYEAKAYIDNNICMICQEDVAVEDLWLCMRNLGKLDSKPTTPHVMCTGCFRSHFSMNKFECGYCRKSTGFYKCLLDFKTDKERKAALSNFTGLIITESWFMMRSFYGDKLREEQNNATVIRLNEIVKVVNNFSKDRDYWQNRAYAAEEIQKTQNEELTRKSDQINDLLEEIRQLRMPAILRKPKTARMGVTPHKRKNPFPQRLESDEEEDDKE